jgi:hypothetical protein
MRLHVVAEQDALALPNLIHPNPGRWGAAKDHQSVGQVVKLLDDGGIVGSQEA